MDLTDYEQLTPIGIILCAMYVIPYSGKFSRVLIFAVFADQGESAKFYSSKISAIRDDLTTRSYTDLARACAVPPAYDISRMGVVDINHKAC